MGHPVFYFACVGLKAHKANPMAGRLAGDLQLHVYTMQFSPHVKKLHGLRRWFAGLQIAAILARYHIHNPVLWFYHPALFALGYSHSDAAIVYDVMDHFPSFEESIDDFYFDELALLAEADIVFTGGRSLHRHIRQMYSELLQGATNNQAKLECIPSGVDYQHFDASTDPSPEIQAFAAPRFVYSGAIDERIDWNIIEALGQATSGTVIMAGPVLRPVPQDLPGNVRLIGAREYNELPSIIAACDVCLLPFQNSALVQFVSPTKTPEYLAMRKPVVSTQIPDVISDYGSLVTVANTPDEFATAAIQSVVDRPDSELVAGQVRSHAKTWDEIARIIADVISLHASSRPLVNA